MSRHTARSRSGNRFWGLILGPADVLRVLSGEKTALRRAGGRYRQGDLLYVRETWEPQGQHGPPRYRAGHIGPPRHAWRPGAQMPRELARVWLRVTRVGAERLEQLTDDGAKAEGFASAEAFRAYWKRRGGPSQYLLVEFYLAATQTPAQQLELPWTEPRCESFEPGKSTKPA